VSERSSCSIHSLILSQSRDMRLRNFAALTTVGLRVQESSESVEAIYLRFWKIIVGQSTESCSSQVWSGQ